MLLDAGECIGLFLKNQSLNNDNLKGTLVTSDVAHPLVVITGTNTYEDHVEEQLLGRSFATTTHVGIRSIHTIAQTNPVATQWTVYGLENSTDVVVDAPASITGLPPVPSVIEHYWAFAFYPDGPSWSEAGDVLISTSKPTMAYNFHIYPNEYKRMMTMTSIPPSSSHASRYAFALPDADGLDVTFNVGYPVGATISINGVEPIPVVPPIEFVSGWMVARYHYTEPAVYVIEGSEPFALTISGDFLDVRYATIGGVAP